MIYEIAGLRVLLDNQYSFTDKFCQAYLAEDQTSPVDIVSRVSQEDLMAEKNLSPQYSDGYIENICLYRNLCLQLPAFNRMLLHAAVLEYNGNGYAFLGRSGAGKSTHTGLWLKYVGGKIVNGDKPILSFNQTEVIAHGTPWMGKEGRGYKASVPLKALCFIEQAKENKIVKLTQSQLSTRLFSQLLIPSEEAAAIKTLDLTDLFLQLVPGYVLYCDISEAAVKTSFETLTGTPYPNNEQGEKNEN